MPGIAAGHFSLFDAGDFAVIEVKNALVATTTEFEREVALLHDEWTVNKRIELTDEVPDRAFVRKLLEDEACK